MSVIHFAKNRKPLQYNYEAVDVACGFFHSVRPIPTREPSPVIALLTENVTCGRCKRTKLFKEAIKKSKATQ